MAALVSSLKTSLNYLLNSDPNATFWSAAERIYYVDEGHKYIVNYWKWPWRLRLNTQNLTSGTQAYTIPSTIRAEDIHSAYFTSTTRNITNQILIPETLEEYQYRVQNTSLASGVPGRYHLAYNSSGTLQFVLNVPPDFSETNGLSIRFYVGAGDLTLDGDTTICPDELDNDIVDYAYHKAKWKEEEPTFIQFKQLLDQKLALQKQVSIVGIDDNLLQVRTPLYSTHDDTFYSPLT